MMVSLWLILGLSIATVAVSALGASFSVLGLGALFSGAVLAVCAMAASLEFAKFVLAAFLHKRWRHLNMFLKTYLLSAIIILSCITSMGIFGFLSNAYQSASSELEAENIRLSSLKNEQNQNVAEIARLTKSIDDIPASRITKRIEARKEAEPAIAALTKKNADLQKQLGEADLKILAVKQKVGPLIYIARAFNLDLDTVVKYLILVFVLVFDPLAICLVIATSECLELRKKKSFGELSEEAPLADQPNRVPSDEVIQMRFADGPDQDAV